MFILHLMSGNRILADRYQPPQRVAQAHRPKQVLTSARCQCGVILTSIHPSIYLLSQSTDSNHAMPHPATITQAKLQKAPSPMAESPLLEESNKDLLPGCSDGMPRGKCTVQFDPCVPFLGSKVSRIDGHLSKLIDIMPTCPDMP